MIFKENLIVLFKNLIKDLKEKDKKYKTSLSQPHIPPKKDENLHKSFHCFINLYSTKDKKAIQVKLFQFLFENFRGGKNLNNSILYFTE